MKRITYLTAGTVIVTLTTTAIESDREGLLCFQPPCVSECNLGMPGEPPHIPEGENGREYALEWLAINNSMGFTTSSGSFGFALRFPR